MILIINTSILPNRSLRSLQSIKHYVQLKFIKLCRCVYQKYRTSKKNRELYLFASFFHNFVEGNKIKIGFTL